MGVRLLIQNQGLSQTTLKTVYIQILPDFGDYIS